jgi:hypothetical protein
MAASLLRDGPVMNRAMEIRLAKLETAAQSAPSGFNAFTADELMVQLLEGYMKEHGRTFQCDRADNSSCSSTCPTRRLIFQPAQSVSNHGEVLMRSQLAISALVVTSLFGSTLIASAQTQTAPGASSEGNVNPGATSVKKTQPTKGMTTGSSTRNGANEGGTVNPSDQDNAGSGAGTMAPPPMSDSKY